MSGAAAKPNGAADAVLVVEHLRAYYRISNFDPPREVRAVDDISIRVGRNEIYGLAGESSSGKTTFIKTIAAAVRPPLRVVAGSIRYSFLDRDIYQLDREALSAVRWKHLSYIPQGSMNVLNPVRRVRQSFIDFAFPHMGLPKGKFFDAVAAHLERLHLQKSVLDAYPHQLSGGMRQRVTIALATVCQPEFIIADEPTTALDVVVQKSVLALIREAQRKIGSSMIFVTHDMAVHANITDRLGIMYAGRLVEEAPTAELFAEPKHPYTQHLIASLPRIGDASSKQALIGTPPNLSNPPAGCRFHPRCPLAMDVCRERPPDMLTVSPAHRVACHAVAEDVARTTSGKAASAKNARVGLVQ